MAAGIPSPFDRVIGILPAAGLPPPDFILPRDGATIVQAMIDDWELVTGKTLYPAQVERLLVNAVAYRETLTRIAAQLVGELCLVRYSRFPMLDFLGDLVGCPRLGTQTASAQFTFTLNAPLVQDVMIPAGTQITGYASQSYVFATTDNVVLVNGSTSVSVSAACTVLGAGPNGIPSGQLNALVAPLAGLPTGATLSVSNTEATAGGTDTEGDTAYRARVLAAPLQQSVGTPGYYRQKVLAVDVNISDVAVIGRMDTNGDPTGYVDIYVLAGYGIPTAALMTEVRSALADESVTMATDVVVPHVPNVVPYSINAAIRTLKTADPGTVMANAQTALTTYVNDRAPILGEDVVPSQIIAALFVDGIYDITLTSPTADITLDKSQWAQLTSSSLTWGGSGND